MQSVKKARNKECFRSICIEHHFSVVTYENLFLLVAIFMVAEMQVENLRGGMLLVTSLATA